MSISLIFKSTHRRSHVFDIQIHTLTKYFLQFPKLYQSEIYKLNISELLKMKSLKLLDMLMLDFFQSQMNREYEYGLC